MAFKDNLTDIIRKTGETVSRPLKTGLLLGTFALMSTGAFSQAHGEGTVQTSQGEPVTNAKVVLDYQEDDQHDQTVYTDDCGRRLRVRRPHLELRRHVFQSRRCLRHALLVVSRRTSRGRTLGTPRRRPSHFRSPTRLRSLPHRVRLSVRRLTRRAPGGRLRRRESSR